MKLITKLIKADFLKKNQIWHDADLSRQQGEELVREMILSLPKGHYSLYNREYGTNLVDTVFEMYGTIPSLLVSQPMMLGLSILFPKKVYAAFTLGMDAIEIK